MALHTSITSSVSCARPIDGIDHVTIFDNGNANGIRPKNDEISVLVAYPHSCFGSFISQRLCRTVDVVLSPSNVSLDRGCTARSAIR